MGYMRHHTIVVSSWDREKIENARTKALELFSALQDGAIVSELTPKATNGFSSFFVAPDGSKEGWDTSDNNDAARKTFTDWLDSNRYVDNSTSLDWVEVQFGDDDCETKICRDSDQRARESKL